MWKDWVFPAIPGFLVLEVRSWDAESGEGGVSPLNIKTLKEDSASWSPGAQGGAGREPRAVRALGLFVNAVDAPARIAVGTGTCPLQEETGPGHGAAKWRSWDPNPGCWALETKLWD